MNSTEQTIRKALTAIRDPRQESPRDVSAMVESLLWQGNKVTCVLGSADDPVLREAIEETLGRAVPFKQIGVVFTQVRAAGKDAGRDTGRDTGREKPETSEIDPSAGIGKIRHVIAVASGKGGVGKSTVAVNLAIILRRLGHKVGLLDADIYGPSVPMMLGVQQHPQSPDGKVMIPIEAHGLQTLSIGYMLANQDPVVWRGPMVHSALQQMLHQALWGALDVLLVDMPPGTGDVALTLAQRGRLSGAVIVTTPQNVALADARKGIGMFRKVDVPILGLIENMAFHQCAQCGSETAIFGSGGGETEAMVQNVPFLGKLPLQPEVCEDGDAGTPVVLRAGSFQGYFTGIATALLAEIARLD